MEQKRSRDDADAPLTFVDGRYGDYWEDESLVEQILPVAILYGGGGVSSRESVP